MGSEFLHVQNARIFTSLDSSGQGVLLHDRKTIVDRAIARIFRNCATVYVVDTNVVDPSTGKKAEPVIKQFTVDKASLKRFLTVNSDYASRSGSTHEKLHGAYAEFLKRHREGVQESYGSFRGTKQEWNRFFGRLQEAGINAPQTFRSMVARLPDHATLRLDEKELMNRLVFAGFGPPKDVPLSRATQKLVEDLKARMTTITDTEKLHLASQFGYEPELKALIESGVKADVVAATSEDGDTPLHAASRSGHEGVVNILLDAGANINKPNKSGETPLHAACLADQPKLAALLIKKGADLTSVTNISKDTPFHSACRSRSPEMVKLFFGMKVMSGGQEVALSEIKNVQKCTPFQLACIVKDPAMIKAFFEDALASGADVNCTDEKGDLPIHLACRAGDAALVQLLLNKGSAIDVLSGSKEKEKPVDIARRLQNQEIELLLADELRKRALTGGGST